MTTFLFLAPIAYLVGIGMAKVKARITEWRPK